MTESPRCKCPHLTRAFNGIKLERCGWAPLTEANSVNYMWALQLAPVGRWVLLLLLPYLLSVVHYTVPEQSPRRKKDPRPSMTCGPPAGWPAAEAEARGCSYRLHRLQPAGHKPKPTPPGRTYQSSQLANVFCRDWSAAAVEPSCHAPLGGAAPLLI